MSGTSRIIVLNQLINVFWTILGFGPLVGYWWTRGLENSFYIFLGVGLLFSLLPEMILNKFKFFKDRKAYERMGIKLVRRLVQDGDWIKSQSGSDAVRMKTSADARAYLSSIAMYERFHWFCCVFFICSAAHALFSGAFIWAIMIFFANFVYNICAIILQQYNKLRVYGLLRKS